MGTSDSERHVTRPNQGLSSLAPGGGKMRDPGNEVGETFLIDWFPDFFWVFFGIFEKPFVYAASPPLSLNILAADLNPLIFFFLFYYTLFIKNINVDFFVKFASSK